MTRVRDVSTDPLGSYGREDDSYLLRFERPIPHPVDRVWAALTEPGLLREWLGEVEIDLLAGGAVTITWLNTGDDPNTFTMSARITELDPPGLLEYAGEPHGVLRFEIRPDGEGSILTLTNTQPRRPEAPLKNLAGWHIHLLHLEEALDGISVDWPGWQTGSGHARWSLLHDRYEAELRG